MKQILFFLLVAMALNANCEIFKCTDVNTGAIEYQSSPCASLTTKQGVVDIKPMNPQEEEQAQRKLQVWRDKQAADEKASMEAKKAKQAELDQQAELDALERNAEMAEQQTLATQKLAREIEQQNRINRYRGVYAIPPGQ